MLHNIHDLLDFAIQIADKAGKHTLAYYQSSYEIETKSDNSPVTIADREAEQLLRSEIEKTFPDHQILGEEFAPKETDSPFKWIIDPIDGTKSFITGVPFYSNLLALEYQGEIILGISNFPALNEMYYAAKGIGAFMNGKTIKVSGTKEISNSRIMVTDVRSLENAEKGIQAKSILNDSYFYRTWADAYGYALVASGRADAMFDPKMNPWDGAPFAIILKEAGGYFGDWNGVETIYGENAFSSNFILKEEILKRLK